MQGNPMGVARGVLYNLKSILRSGRADFNANQRISLWVGLLFICIAGRVQLRAAVFQHLPLTLADASVTLDSALTLAIGSLSAVIVVQYRENRKKEDAATKMAVDAATAIKEASNTMHSVVDAMDRLTDKVIRCPINPSADPRLYPRDYPSQPAPRSLPTPSKNPGQSY